MKILLAGATGALGRQLVPKLLAAGHEVAGMTRGELRRQAVLDLGATPVVADALDRDQVARAVADVEPEAILHELTALTGALGRRNIDRSFVETQPRYPSIRVGLAGG